MLVSSGKTKKRARFLEREPSRLWSGVLAALPLLAHLLFPNQVASLIGLPPNATWFVVFTLAYVIFLSFEVGLLRRQVKALHQLRKGDA